MLSLRFEFAYERPHCDLLLALPPTFSSSMMYHLFFTNSMVVEILSHGNGLLIFLCFCESYYKEISTLQFQSYVLHYFYNSLFLYSSLADVQPTLCVVSHRHELRTAHDCRVAVESQASADARPRERETVVRVRIRKTALRPVVSGTPNAQQLATCRSPEAIAVVRTVTSSYGLRKRIPICAQCLSCNILSTC